LNKNRLKEWLCMKLFGINNELLNLVLVFLYKVRVHNVFVTFEASKTSKGVLCALKKD
jgi:hypothetical protein